MKNIYKHPIAVTFVVGLLVSWLPLSTVKDSDHSFVSECIAVVGCSVALSFITFLSKQKTFGLLVLWPLFQGFVNIFIEWNASQSVAFLVSVLLAGWILYKSSYFSGPSYAIWTGEPHQHSKD